MKKHMPKNKFFVSYILISYCNTKLKQTKTKNNCKKRKKEKEKKKT